MQRLELRQKQQMVMTKELQQSIELLQLNQTELQQFVQEQLDSNPLLVDMSDGEVAIEEEQSQRQERQDMLALTKQLYREGGTKGGDKQNGSSQTDIFERISAKEGFYEQIWRYISLEIKTSQGQEIAIALTTLLDDKGYISVELEQVASQCNVSIEAVEVVLSMMQACDQPGLFARNLSECLALQLADQSLLTPQISLVLAHLDLLSVGAFDKVMQLAGITSKQELRDVITLIKQCEPNPMRYFQLDESLLLPPDLIVRQDKNGVWYAELNHELLPNIILDQTLLEHSLKHERQDRSIEFIKQHQKQANWLLQALKQRSHTLYRVTNAIVARQQAYFNQGVRGLAALNQQQIAEDVAMHESTISRVIQGKTLLTPHGTLALKYFFTSSIKSEQGGEALSSTVIKEKIKSLIAAEKPNAILSDEQIVQSLSIEGIAVARRTVAKYREALRIPTSQQRRRQQRYLLECD